MLEWSAQAWLSAADTRRTLEDGVLDLTRNVCNMNFDDVSPMVENIIILDSEGKRIAVKYYGDAR